MSKRKLTRRKGIWFEYTYDAMYPCKHERITKFWKRYWRKWADRESLRFQLYGEK